MREEHPALSTPTPKKLSQLYANGFLVNLLSPKAALFYYAFLPQFIDPARGAAGEQLLILGGLFALLASCTDSLYALIGSTMGQWLRRSVRFQHIQRYVTGSIYILLGLLSLGRRSIHRENYPQPQRLRLQRRGRCQPHFANWRTLLAAHCGLIVQPSSEAPSSLA